MRRFTQEDYKDLLKPHQFDFLKKKRGRGRHGGWKKTLHVIIDEYIHVYYPKRKELSIRKRRESKEKSNG